ncbi:MAG: Stk1 family PASTA domain-containing Ser/Thr kinase [Firmicutes bacterium]|nr:Stk1 family PASTA domain-containing Ser/Thr kinase [Bacillota bacterium]
MIGKILSNRYQIVEKIGDGGTAFVYKGMDNLLNRHVTIKVLRPEYVSDQDFVRRFRREAQAAASLSHANIVSIYDVGFENGIHYIVMEYIPGQSLKELIESQGRLPYRTAAEYAMQIALALNNAHKHGIIHRDVKPHNILISDDGRVKVTDFGIAQAVTASTVTYSGAILGSVHYFSPEQARGGATGEKSDIYSLGIVLYEMLTGEVPFSGDSPVSIAVKHLQEPFPDAQNIDPDIPDTLNKIIKRAVEKEPEKRYQSAKEMAEELSAWLQGREERRTIDPVPVKGEISAQRDEKKQKKINRKKITLIAGSLFLILILILSVNFILKTFIVPEVEVPSVEGETLQDATDILKEAGLEANLAAQIPSDTVPAGRVIKQEPAAGRIVKKNRVIDLTVSTGPELIEVDNVVGKMQREATLILNNKGFEVVIVEVHSEEPPQTVIAQDPGAGYKIQKGSTVTLRVSKGGQPFKLQDLRGRTLEDAQNWLQFFGLKLRHVSEQYNDDYGAGLICDQFPEPGESVQAGDFVDLVVSKGPEQPELEEHKITIKTDDIPEGEEITVIIHDESGNSPRIEKYTSDGQPIITTGWGSGTVEVRWQDKVEVKNFP